MNGELQEQCEDFLQGLIQSWHIVNSFYIVPLGAKMRYYRAISSQPGGKQNSARKISLGRLGAI